MGLRRWIASLLGAPPETDRELGELRSHLDRLEDQLDSQERAIEHLLDVATRHTDRIDELDALDDRVDAIESRLDGISTPTSAENSFDRSRKQEALKKIAVASGRSDGQVQRDLDAADRVAGIDEGERLWNEATRAQQGILKLMYDSGYPLSYREMADELGRSISTVKNHINNLKSMGVEFKEDTGPNNTKKYLLDERIKTFLTLRLND